MLFLVDAALYSLLIFFNKRDLVEWEALLCLSERHS